MSRLTTQLSITFAGLRGPGLTSADMATLDTKVAQAESSRAGSASFATLAGLYANSGTDAPIPGAPSGERGALYWVGRANAIANAETDADVAGFAPGLRGSKYWSLQASLQAANIGLTTQPLNEIVETDQDANGRYWSQKYRDGTMGFQGIRDAKGNLIDQIALLNRTRIQALEDVSSADIPAAIKRLRRTFYTALNAVPIQAASSFVSLSGNDTGANNLLPNGVEYDKSDPRIRRLGGPWVIAGATFPGNQVLAQRNVTYLTSAGSQAGNPQIELLISAGVTQIEIKGAGCTYIGVMIDGKMTQQYGEIVTPAISSGGYRTHLLTLSASAQPRRVRLMFQANVSIGAIRVNAGGALLDPTIPRQSSCYVIANSIGEGTGASQTKVSGWVARYGQIMGFDSIANGGVGGSGWAKSISSGENALSRIPDILGNDRGGPPDLLLCALGINDSNTDLAPVTANIRTFMNQIRAAAPTMPVICLGPFGGYTGWGDQAAKQAAIFSAMGEYRHTYTVDTAPLWANPPYPTWYNSGVDPVHPIDAGHTAIANFVRDATLPILKGL